MGKGQMNNPSKKPCYHLPESRELARRADKLHIVQLGFFWLVGPMEIQAQDVNFKGEEQQWNSKVLIKKCRYLEVSGCKGMCLNMW